MTVARIADRLARCYSGAVFDALREAGHTACTLPHEIKCVDPRLRVAGPVFTVSGHLEPGLDPHETLLRWTEFLSAVPANSVVVCQPNDHSIAHMGELSAETLQFRGVRGYVVDGGSRDTAFILKLGFPVFCRYLCPHDVVGTWVPDEFDAPIRIGTVDVHPGDYVFGDIDGVVVIPAARALETVERVEEVMRTENKVRKAILQGMDPKQAYLRYGLF